VVIEESGRIRGDLGERGGVDHSIRSGGVVWPDGRAEKATLLLLAWRTCGVVTGVAGAI
jgi:hypothetical protein